MSCFIDGREEMPFIKGSSKPKEDDMLDNQLTSMINSQNVSHYVFKNGGKDVIVTDVKVCGFWNIKKGDYLVCTKEKYNYAFEGTVQLSYSKEDLVITCPRTIKGYFLSTDDKEIQMIFKEIQIYE